MLQAGLTLCQTVRYYVGRAILRPCKPNRKRPRWKQGFRPCLADLASVRCYLAHWLEVWSKRDESIPRNNGRLSWLRQLFVQPSFKSPHGDVGAYIAENISGCREPLVFSFLVHPLLKKFSHQGPVVGSRFLRQVGHTQTVKLFLNTPLKTVCEDAE